MNNYVLNKWKTTTILKKKKKTPPAPIIFAILFCACQNPNLLNCFLKYFLIVLVIFSIVFFPCFSSRAYGCQVSVMCQPISIMAPFFSTKLICLMFAQLYFSSMHFPILLCSLLLLGTLMNFCTCCRHLLHSCWSYAVHHAIPEEALPRGCGIHIHYSLSQSHPRATPKAFKGFSFVSIFRFTACLKTILLAWNYFFDILNLLPDAKMILETRKWREKEGPEGTQKMISSLAWKGPVKDGKRTGSGRSLLAGRAWRWWKRRSSSGQEEKKGNKWSDFRKSNIFLCGLGCREWKSEVPVSGKVMKRTAIQKPIYNV